MFYFLRNKKVNWMVSHPYDKLGSSGESSQGGGGSLGVVNNLDRAPELEPLLAEPSQEYRHDYNYHRPSYYRHQNTTFVPRSSIRYLKVSVPTLNQVNLFRNDRVNILPIDYQFLFFIFSQRFDT